MSLNIQQARQLIQDFDFSNLFIRELGWSNPTSHKSASLSVGDETYSRQQIAQLLGVVVFEITAANGQIPNSNQRLTIYREIVQISGENLLIFVDEKRTQSLWYWVKRDGTKLYPRDHVYVKREPCDLLLSKVSTLKISLEELDTISVIDVAQRLQSGLDVERVTKKFFEEFKQQHVEFLNLIRGIDKDTDRRWYTSVLLNRLMFVYFLQRKGFIDNDRMLYLQEKLAESKQRGTDLFYSEFLKILFFEGFAKPQHERSSKVETLIGNIKYLNGGLFLEHPIEQSYPNIAIPDVAFEKILDLFARYSWNLDDTVGGKENEINPAVLGYIFEKYINQKAFGAYYTRPEITEYLCDRTINKLILDRVNQGNSPGKFETITELLTNLDANLCRRLLDEILPNLSLLDPACGSGAFLVAAMKTLIYIYSTVIGRSKFLTDHHLENYLKKIESEHLSLNYYIKKRIISDNLYGVDIMPEAVEIAKLRLFLALVSAAHDVSELEPLPNIDFNIMAGNSLIGLIRVDDAEFEGSRAQLNLFHKTYRQVLEEKNRLISIYRHATTYSQDLQSLRDEIAEKKASAIENINKILLEDFKELKIKFEQAQISGKPIKRTLTLADIEALKPFHWGYEFDEILHQRGGFDAIIANPPWETFKPQSKEFFAQHSELVTKNKMDIKAFEKEQKKLLQDAEIAEAWLEYQSNFPHISAYYRSAEQYKNQISIVNGKKAGTDINLYKLFVEQCYNLLRDGGDCGIVIPSGIYTDLGTKQLREMLFEQTNVTGLFCLENRRTIFEGVHRSFKIVVLTFEKGSTTTEFPSAFMRLDVQELQGFPNDESLKISVELVRRLSPDSLSVMEFKNLGDIRIAEKIAMFPALGEQIENKWNLKLSQEIHMTNDSHLFQTEPGQGLVPLTQGNMFHQFNHNFALPKYYINLDEGRSKVIGRVADDGQKLAYQDYRLVHRRIGRNTDKRSLIACILPRNRFCADTAQTVRNILSYTDTLFITAVFNSFVADFEIRKRITAHLDMHFMYSVRLPRLTTGDKYFSDIVQRAAKLICTAPEFDELAAEVGLNSHKEGVTDETERAKLRAELDGIIAHLYGLTEAEFAHILTTFPIVPETVKQAALAAYCSFAA